MQRRFPRPWEIRRLVKFRKFIWNGKVRRLSRAMTIEDLRKLAKKRTPKGQFDYVEGGSEAEITLQRNLDYFQKVQFSPHVLRDISAIDLSSQLLGEATDLPFGFAPTGYTRMMHVAGEVAVSSAAAKAKIPYVLSTMGTTSMSELANEVKHGNNWFQLYLWKDREKSLKFLADARSAGVETLVLTVDVPRTSRRLRDVRNGLTIPPTITLKTFLNTLTRFGWLKDFLSTEPLTFASFADYHGTIADLSNSMFDPTNTFEDLKWLRNEWSGHLVIKGVQRSDDVRKAIDAGVNAVWLSNHGGRQLDRSPSPMELLPEMISRFGEEIDFYVDGGITSGADIVTAIALGAKYAFVGRAYLYGLMAGGEAGVDRAIEILRTEMMQTMIFLGASSLQELTPDLIHPRSH